MTSKQYTDILIDQYLNKDSGTNSLKEWRLSDVARARGTDDVIKKRFWDHLNNNIIDFDSLVRGYYSAIKNYISYNPWTLFDSNTGLLTSKKVIDEVNEAKRKRNEERQTKNIPDSVMEDIDYAIDGLLKIGELQFGNKPFKTLKQVEEEEDAKKEDEEGRARAQQIINGQKVFKESYDKYKKLITDHVNSLVDKYKQKLSNGYNTAKYVYNTLANAKYNYAYIPFSKKELDEHPGKYAYNTPAVRVELIPYNLDRIPEKTSAGWDRFYYGYHLKIYMFNTMVYNSTETWSNSVDEPMTDWHIGDPNNPNLDNFFKDMDDHIDQILRRANHYKLDELYSYANHYAKAIALSKALQAEVDDGVLEGVKPFVEIIKKSIAKAVGKANNEADKWIDTSDGSDGAAYYMSVQGYADRLAPSLAYCNWRALDSEGQPIECKADSDPEELRQLVVDLVNSGGAELNILPKDKI